MKYKLIRKVNHGKMLIGYELQQENGNIVNMLKSEVLKLAHQGLIVNAVYNARSKSLSGSSGTDLRRLPTVQYKELKGAKKSKEKVPQQPKSNHALAKQYIETKEASGKLDIKVEFLPNDEVRLVEVLDKNNTGTFVMPTFITEHDSFKDYTFMSDLYVRGPFSGCKFTNAVINHSYTDWTGLFGDMDSDKLSIKYNGKDPVKSLRYAFSACRLASVIDLNNLDNSHVKSMRGIFLFCTKLTKLDLKGFNTSNVTDMAYMFRYCTSLIEADFSNFNTSKVTSMRGMFCESAIKVLDLRRFDTREVTDMHFIFSGSEAKKIMLSGFNTSKVTRMDYMFSRVKLPELDLSNFDFSNVDTFEAMFFISKIDTINLGKFNAKKSAEGLGDMFSCFKGKKPKAYTILNIHT